MSRTTVLFSLSYKFTQMEVIKEYTVMKNGKTETINKNSISFLGLIPAQILLIDLCGQYEFYS